MAVKVTMPKLGLTMTEGTIVEWRKEEGEKVGKGEILYVIETEKVSFDVESPESGVLGKIVAQVGDVIPVGWVVAYILEPGEKVSDIAELIEAGKVEPVPEAPTVAAEPAGKEGVATGGERLRVKISPMARKIAEERGVDISGIKGTGPGGRIVKEDVLRAVEQMKTAAVPPVSKEEVPSVGEEEIKPLSSMRKVMAKRMEESFQAPHFYLTIEVDTQELEDACKQLMPAIEDKVGIKLTFTDLLIKMVARSLEYNPELNCAYVDGSLKIFHSIHIGLVTAVEGGLVVPVIREANKKSLADVVADRSELVQKAIERRLSREEMSGSTFTITSLGMFGIDQFSAILQPPEAAILAVGRIADRPVAREGQVVIRPMMTLTLSIDHRVLDGVLGANFLTSLKNYIENPDIASLAG